MQASDDMARAPLARWLPVVYAVSFTGLGALVPYLALTLRGWGIEGWTLALALGALPLGRLVSVPLWSLAADMFQAATWVLRLGAALATLGAWLLWGWGEGSAVTVMCAMFLLAVGRAPSGPVLDGIALASLPKLDRNAYGRVRRWGSVGFLLSVFVVGWLADHTVIEPFDVVLFTAIGFLALTMAMPQLGQIERVRIGFALRSLARDVHIWWVLLVAALHFGAHVGITAFLAVHLDSLGYGAAWTGTALALGVGIEVWVMTVAHRLLRRWDPTTLFLVATLVGMARWLAMEQTTSGELLVGLQGLHGVSFGLFWIAGVAIMNRRAPSEVAISAQGLLAVAVGGVGSAIGTMGGSWIVTEMTTTDLFVGAQALSIVAILGAFAVRWTR